MPGKMLAIMDQVFAIARTGKSAAIMHPEHTLTVTRRADGEFEAKCACGGRWVMKASEQPGEALDKYTMHMKNADRHKIHGDTKPL